MISAILVFGVFNWTLGFALAVGLAQWPKVRRLRFRLPRKVGAVEHHALPAQPEPPASPLPPPRPALVTPVVELPTAWLDALEENAVVATSFVEASVQVLRLEVGKYRERLLVIDDELRGLAAPATSDQLLTIATELREVNVEWLGKQADAASHLGSRRGSLGSFEEAGHELETVLLDQAAQIETTISNLQILDFSSEPEVGRKKLTRELCRLVDLSHVLRDRMSESLLSIMVAEGKTADIDRKFQTDGLTGLTNRFGLEMLLADWWHDDPARQRLASCVLIDLDRVHKLNEKYGPRRCDAFIGGFGRWLEAQLRRDRGCDRVTRLSGQAFLVFLGDTGPRNATSVAERVRQTLAVTTFEYNDELIELTTSLGVVEVDKKDTSATLIKHVQQCVRAAKQAGRNQTALDEGAGALPVEPPKFQVKAKVVKLQ